MADSTNIHPGLQDEAVFAARQKHGSNIIPLKEDKVLLRVLKEVVMEPMFLLLLAACAIYFLLRQYEEGFIMLVAICIVAGISFYQEFRSRNAVQALRRLSAAKARVMRNSTEQERAAHIQHGAHDRRRASGQRLGRAVADTGDGGLTRSLSGSLTRTPASPRRATSRRLRSAAPRPPRGSRLRRRPRP